MRKALYIGILFCICNHSVSAQPDSRIDSAIFDYSVLGYNNLKYSINLDTAEYYLNKALQLQYSTPGYEIDERVVGNHINLASVYRKIHNNNKALEHLNKAEEILIEIDPESVLFGTIYNNKGNIIKGYYDIYRTKQYYEYAFDWLDKKGYKNSVDFLEVFSNYLDLLFQIGEFELAIEKLEEVDISLLSLTADLRFDFHTLKAKSYRTVGNYEEALIHLSEAKKVIDSGSLEQEELLRYSYYIDLISLYIEALDYENAYKEIREAQLQIESFGKYSSKLRTTFQATFQYLYARILFAEGKYNNVIDIVDLNIQILNDFFKEQSLSELNSHIKDEYSSLIPEFNTLKSKAFYNLYLTNPSLEILMKASQSYEETIEILNAKKISIQEEDSKLFATANIIDVYKEAIQISQLLFNSTHEIEYLDKAFWFTESSKSFALYSEIKEIEAIEYSDLPPAIKQKEEELLGMIQAYEEMLFDEQLSLDPDQEIIETLKSKLFHLNDDYSDLMNDIENNYSKYFEFKYNPKFASISEVQEKLPYRDALIEYVLTDTMLLTYVIDSKGVNIITQEVGPEFSQECFEYYGLMYTQNFSNGVKKNYERYVELGRKFYSILIEPCLQYTDKKNLTIVPDGAITYIPFEGLLVEDADQNYINYLNLPYLIREYSIGYSHSATLLFSERLKTKSPKEKVLAFAPRYYNPLSNADSTVIRQVLAEGNLLLPLVGVIKEVQSINETVPSRVFLNEDATEANFKKYASDYNVLHLAMHTLLKDDNPMHSLLAFTNIENPEDTTGEDNKLYAYEIYNLKLNAQMIVLSACSSGFGKMQKGEGMMSLARGFMYAGCPSIVMTLWQVSDKSSSELMTSFYKYLKRGKSKQEAMRLAKIDYLEGADDLTSNPYFWSGFVVVGDSTPIYKKSGMAYYISIIVVFIMVLVFFQYRRH